MHTDIYSLISLIVCVVIVLIIIGFLFYDKFSREKIRVIRIIKKRKSVRDLPYDPKRANGTPHPPTYEFHTITVDFVYEGKKHINTYFINEKQYKKLQENGTYKVRMKYPHILSIIEKIPMDK